jgi:DNA-3-methyladenine glycosylase II
VDDRAKFARGPSARTPDLPKRTVTIAGPFDLVRTTAPIWWGRGRWPNVDWRDGAFFWVGWEDGQLAWRSVRQADAFILQIQGASDAGLDVTWAAAVLGSGEVMPQFEDSVLERLAGAHSGLRPWSAGSFFAGVVTSIVGQSISVAAAATTERRLFALFNEPINVGGRTYWPPPRPEQLGSACVEFVRSSGVTTRRAEALVSVGALFAKGAVSDCATSKAVATIDSDLLLAIPGIGPWTMRSALLWGVGDADSHPTGDVALLRAAKRRYPSVTGLKDLDRLSDGWKPFRGWAARLLWLDLLGFDGERRSPENGAHDISIKLNPHHADPDPLRPLATTGQTPP